MNAPDTSVPPGTYAGDASEQRRMAVEFDVMLPADITALAKLPAELARAIRRTGLTCSAPVVRPAGDRSARPELDDSQRSQVEEARAALACFAGQPVWGIGATLHDHGRVLLDLLDKIAPKEADGD